MSTNLVLKSGMIISNGKFVYRIAEIKVNKKRNTWEAYVNPLHRPFEPIKQSVIMDLRGFRILEGDELKFWQNKRSYKRLMKAKVK